jgi:hypothetical protein
MLALGAALTGCNSVAQHAIAPGAGLLAAVLPYGTTTTQSMKIYSCAQAGLPAACFGPTTSAQLAKFESFSNNLGKSEYRFYQAVSASPAGYVIYENP